MSMYDVIANQPVVIDNGSGVIKAGFAGEQMPKCRFPNFVGRPKHVRVMAGALEGDIFIGPKAEEYRGLLSLKYPMEHSIVTDWNDMERVWQYVYSNDQLKAEPSEHPVLLTEAPLNPISNREKAAEIFFETFNVPALYIQMQAVLSLYSSGRTTGVVLDCGDGVSHVVPIYEGFAIEHGIQRMDVAGRDVTRYLRLLLRKEGHIFHRTSEFEIVREIKESKCRLLSNVYKEETSDTKVVHTLPDGSKLEVGAAHYRAPEVLFRPDLIGEEYDGVAHGGSTMFPGFGDRLLAEMRKLAPKDVKVRILAPQERLYSTWIGGSILASLDTFRKIWVSKQINFATMFENVWAKLGWGTTEQKPIEKTTPEAQAAGWAKDKDEEDRVEKMIRDSGCWDHHLAVVHCMFDHNDWRKCQNELTVFKTCMLPKTRTSPDQSNKT
ncbi:actin domain-containing protein [Ditylenchus destructor]|uniref:Actin domain-containing protein n=1 Tax=Ditylenchus destructor TaxID=166010 RepID=A0AAD4N1P9_9BILA|nr:actin domain-containing protein [Ditylenchus destructor]